MEIGGGYISGGDKMKKSWNFYRKYKFKVAMWIIFREEFKSGVDKKIDFQGENYFFNFYPTEFFLPNPDLDSSQKIMHVTPLNYEFRTKIRRFLIWNR